MPAQLEIEYWALFGSHNLQPVSLYILGFGWCFNTAELKIIPRGERVQTLSILPCVNNGQMQLCQARYEDMCGGHPLAIHLIERFIIMYTLSMESLIIKTQVQTLHILYIQETVQPMMQNTLFDNETILKRLPWPPGGAFVMAPCLTMFRAPNCTSVPSFILL